MDPAELRARAGEVSRLMRAMSNPHRMMVLSHLANREMNVTELHRAIGVRYSALSQHLARLRGDGLVQSRRDKQTIYYSLKGDITTEIIKAVCRAIPERAAAA